MVIFSKKGNRKDIGVQLMCAASYDIILWCRDMDTDQTRNNKLGSHRPS